MKEQDIESYTEYNNRRRISLHKRQTLKADLLEEKEVHGGPDNDDSGDVPQRKRVVLGVEVLGPGDMFVSKYLCYCFRVNVFCYATASDSKMSSGSCVF